MLHQIKAQQFYTDLVLHQQSEVLHKIVEFEDFFKACGSFSVLFKADLIFKYLPRKPSLFKCFSSLYEPWEGIENQ